MMRSIGSIRGRGGGDWHLRCASPPRTRAWMVTAAVRCRVRHSCMARATYGTGGGGEIGGYVERKC